MVWAQVLTTYYVLIIYRYDEEKQSSTCIQIVKLTIIPERGHSRSGCNFVKCCWEKREENEYLLCEIDVEAINSTWKFFLYIHFILLHGLEVCVCVCVFVLHFLVHIFPWHVPMVKGHNEIIILFMNCQDDVHIVVFFFNQTKKWRQKVWLSMKGRYLWQIVIKMWFHYYQSNFGIYWKLFRQ